MRKLDSAVELIKKWEGRRLDAYLDPVNIPTIGYGTIIYPDGSKVKMGQSISEAEATSYLMHEVRKKAEGVEKYVKVTLTEGQYNALVSFAYNVGVGAFSKSTLLKKLNSGDASGAADEFKRWNKAGGKVLKGLVKRREDERKLFSTPVVGLPKNPAPVVKDETKKAGWLQPLKMLFAKIIEALFGVPAVDETKPVTVPDSKPETKTFSAGNGPRITREEVVSILKSKGADPDKVCLLGIRGYYLDSMGVVGKNDRRIYDDALIWCFPNGFMTYKANTDPNGYRKGSGTGSGKGMANLREGHWKYTPGRHKTYAAFRQAAAVTVLRDGSPNYDDTGWFGINIHSGGHRTTSSLGCVTIPKPKWSEFKGLGYKKLKEANQKNFSFVLIHEDERRT